MINLSKNKVSRINDYSLYLLNYCIFKLKLFTKKSNLLLKHRFY